MENFTRKTHHSQRSDLNSQFSVLNSPFKILSCCVSKVTVNKTTSLEIEFADQGITVDGKSFSWDIAKLSGGYFHILHSKKSYKAEVVKADQATKTFTFKINNHLHTVEVKDKFDLLLEKLG